MIAGARAVPFSEMAFSPGSLDRTGQVHAPAASGEERDPRKRRDSQDERRILWSDHSKQLEQMRVRYFSGQNRV